MAGLSLLAVGILLLVIAISWLSYFASRPWTARWRILVVLAGELAILAPLWSAIPAKMYFHSVCKDAGIEILSDKGYGLTLYEDLVAKNSVDALRWNVKRNTQVWSRKSDGAPVARIQSYRIDDGYRGYVKPWMSDDCPTEDATRTRMNNELQKRLLERK